MGVALALLAGLLVGAAAGFLWARQRNAAVVPVDPVTVPDQREAGLGLARRSIEAMHLGVVVLDSDNEVVILNDAARRLRIADEERVLPDLLRLGRTARQDGRPAACELELRHDVPDAIAVRAQASPLGVTGHVALFVQDISESRRVEAVRRDFVANVSHELKTPVGALALLAEAIAD
ncbi:MAG: histidine kinase dimerization/phospho-acceptor domain-containing protein, partial [Mycobacteriales bacterium]